jgi:sigma-B regulation protein RsbU (phosphoserine phosphatase)
MPNKILVVDDEPDLELLIRQRFRKKIQAQDLDFVFAGNGLQALDRLQADAEIAIVLTDINMPEMDGLTLLNLVSERYPLLRSVIVSAYGDMTNIRTAMNRGAFDFITKPIDFQDFEITIDKTLREALAGKQAERDRGLLVSLQQELSVARRIQESILHRTFPPFPERREFEIHAEMIPAREVGGDFYDFFFIDHDRLGFVIGDVSGKGVPSALFMAVSKTLLKATALTGLPPDECLQRVNRILFVESPAAMFVSAFYGILDTRTGEVLYSNGGHNCPLILRRDGRIEPTEAAGGTVLAMLGNSAYHSARLVLDPGEALFLYTDGVSEATDPDDVEFAEHQLEQSLQPFRASPLADAVRYVIDKVRVFSAGAPQADDITVLALRRAGDR